MNKNSIFKFLKILEFFKQRKIFQYLNVYGNSTSSSLVYGTFSDPFTSLPLPFSDPAFRSYLDGLTFLFLEFFLDFLECFFFLSEELVVV